jgi:hypothetical protein
VLSPGHTRGMSPGAKRTQRKPKQRKPKAKLPPVPRYVRSSGGGRRYWRLGGPLTRDHEAEARAAQAAKPPGRLGRLVLRLLGGGQGKAPPR